MNNYLSIGSIENEPGFFAKYNKMSEIPEYVEGFETAIETLYPSADEQKEIKENFGSSFNAINSKSKDFKKEYSKERSDIFDMGCSIGCLTATLHEIWSEEERIKTLEIAQVAVFRFIQDFFFDNQRIPSDYAEFKKSFEDFSAEMAKEKGSV